MKKILFAVLALLSLWPRCSYAQSGAAGTVINTPFNCGTSADGQFVGTGNPLVAPPLATSGGTLTAATYYVVYTFFDFVGNETLSSPEASIVLGSTGGITVNPPVSGLPQTAAGMRIYISTTSGAETLQGATAGSNSFTQSVPLVSGSALPASNSTICKIVANGAIWPVGTGYTVSLADSSGNSLPGYPMQWQFATPGTQVNVSNGLPYYHGIVMYPSPILASPLNHATQSIAGSLSLGTYTLYAGRLNVAGTNGFTGTKTMGSCTVTITGGIITNVTGC